MRYRFRNKNVEILIVIFIIVFIIITFGWFQKKKEIEEEKNSIENEINNIQNRISELKKNKVNLDQKKNNILLYVRIIIAVILISINYVFYINCVKSNDIISIMESLLTLDSLIIMIYTFIAFITYGTVKNFSNALKSSVSIILEKKHIDSTEEFIFLENKLEVLKKQLFDKNNESENYQLY